MRVGVGMGNNRPLFGLSTLGVEGSEHALVKVGGGKYTPLFVKDRLLGATSRPLNAAEPLRESRTWAEKSIRGARMGMYLGVL